MASKISMRDIGYDVKYGFTGDNKETNDDFATWIRTFEHALDATTHNYQQRVVLLCTFLTGECREVANDLINDFRTDAEHPFPTSSSGGRPTVAAIDAYHKELYEDVIAKLKKHPTIIGYSPKVKLLDQWRNLKQETGEAVQTFYHRTLRLQKSLKAQDPPVTKDSEDTMVTFLSGLEVDAQTHVWKMRPKTLQEALDLAVASAEADKRKFTLQNPVGEAEYGRDDGCAMEHCHTGSDCDRAVAADEESDSERHYASEEATSESEYETPRKRRRRLQLQLESERVIDTGGSCTPRSDDSDEIEFESGHDRDQDTERVQPNSGPFGNGARIGEAQHPGPSRMSGVVLGDLPLRTFEAWLGNFELHDPISRPQLERFFGACEELSMEPGHQAELLRRTVDDCLRHRPGSSAQLGELCNRARSAEHGRITNHHELARLKDELYGVVLGVPSNSAPHPRSNRKHQYIATGARGFKLQRSTLGHNRAPASENFDLCTAPRDAKPAKSLQLQNRRGRMRSCEARGRADGKVEDTSPIHRGGGGFIDIEELLAQAKAKASMRPHKWRRHG